MLIGALTTDPFSLSDAAGLLAGGVVLGVLVVCIALCAEEPPISDFLRQMDADGEAARAKAAGPPPHVKGDGAGLSE
ncbi:hypothetical protein [Hyphomicrobium sp.]|uniref:hypothetical protein n=1 Tax=Hyphomicrobium sp. TaxID=82 RepID=UPI002D791CD2|nr:hypothetical protein [Hyphomicrobium sp.]HET6388304.1 hypothetical protein [Hyphomicrobium sp.]